MIKWRNELTALMDISGFQRKPALRRSNLNEYLLATDYPMTADKQSVQSFIIAAEQAGWQTKEDRGWIHLNRAPQFEAAEQIPDPGPEAACCLSLLNRHPDGRTASDGCTERMLLKAMEEGSTACEHICRKLHCEWAVLLRSHSGLPDIDIRFLGG